MKNIFNSRKGLIITSIIILAIVGFFVFSNEEDITADIEMAIVETGDVKKVVSETGFVQASREVILAFERGGLIASIPVQEGDVVNEGDIVIGLDTSEKKTELASAYARLRAEQVRLSELIRGADTVSLNVTESAVDAAETTLQNTKINLEEVTTQQNQLLATAETNLRITGLQAYLTNEERESSSDSYVAPTVSGTYNGEEEGVYNIELYNSGGASGSSYRVTGLEEGTNRASAVNPTPVGLRGLYIQFPTNFASRTEWQIPIPNTRSSSYLTYLNAYNTAIETHDLAIKTAENAVKSAEAALEQTKQQYTQVSSSARDEQVEAQQAVVSQMSASVKAVEIAIGKMTLEAPFTGIVTKMYPEEGEIISASTPVLSLISDENFELVVNISESDIQEVTIDDTATVIFDAYDDAVFEAKVVDIAPSTEIIEGVRVFEITLQFIEKDKRIRVGLSADIDILAAERMEVIEVPTRAIVERTDGKFVRSWDGASLKYIPVQTGLRGSDGLTEIISGLDEGVEIITFAREDDIAKLEQANQ
jgi:RND family efflux transporter MFP subunit